MDTIPDCSVCDYLKKIFYKPEEKHHTDYHSSEHIKYLKFMKLSENTVFPPWPATCPDYWKVGNENECININNIGDCKSSDSDNVMKFDEPIFQGNKGAFYKCNWANKCKAPWEGIDSIC